MRRITITFRFFYSASYFWMFLTKYSWIFSIFSPPIGNLLNCFCNQNQISFLHNKSGGIITTTNTKTNNNSAFHLGCSASSLTPQKSLTTKSAASLLCEVTTLGSTRILQKHPLLRVQLQSPQRFCRHIWQCGCSSRLHTDSAEAYLVKMALLRSTRNVARIKMKL